jgi:hypothetical protein
LTMVWSARWSSTNQQRVTGSSLSRNTAPPCEGSRALRSPRQAACAAGPAQPAHPRRERPHREPGHEYLTGVACSDSPIRASSRAGRIDPESRSTRGSGLGGSRRHRRMGLGREEASSMVSFTDPRLPTVPEEDAPILAEVGGNAGEARPGSRCPIFMGSHESATSAGFRVAGHR